jgi:tetratricopeptide (TPR) repeat protein
LTFYDSFVAQNPSSRPLHAEAARAYRRVGDSYYHLNDTTAADAAYRRSASLFDELLKTEADSPEFRAGYVEAVIRLGVDADKVDQNVAQMIHRAVNFADDLSGEENKHNRELLARVLLREGNVYRKAGDVTGAEACYKQSIRAWPAPLSRRRAAATRLPARRRDTPRIWRWRSCILIPTEPMPPGRRCGTPSTNWTTSGRTAPFTSAERPPERTRKLPPSP